MIRLPPFNPALRLPPPPPGFGPPPPGMPPPGMPPPGMPPPGMPPPGMAPPPPGMPPPGAPGATDALSAFKGVYNNMMSGGPTPGHVDPTEAQALKDMCRPGAIDSAAKDSITSWLGTIGNSDLARFIFQG